MNSVFCGQKGMKRGLVLALVGFLLAAGGLHLYLLDGLDGWFWSTGFADDTAYTPGYSDSAFRRVRWSSMTEQQVRELLGEPFGEVWLYDDEYKIHLAEGVVERSYGTRSRASEPARGASRELALALAGVPTEKRWVYSRSASDDSYRERIVAFRRGRVWQTIHEFYLD